MTSGCELIIISGCVVAVWQNFIKKNHIMKENRQRWLQAIWPLIAVLCHQSGNFLRYSFSLSHLLRLRPTYSIPIGYSSLLGNRADTTIFTPYIILNQMFVTANVSIWQIIIFILYFYINLYNVMVYAFFKLPFHWPFI